jgi:hypothetical protein
MDHSFEKAPSYKGDRAVTALATEARAPVRTQPSVPPSRRLPSLPRFVTRSSLWSQPRLGRL